MVWRLPYQVLVHVAAALLLPRLLWKARGNPAYRRDWSQRLRAGPPLSGSGRIWIHAVSVGEVAAARPIVDALRAHLPDVRLLITTTTPTGRAEARRHLGDTVDHRYLPIDLPWLVPAFLRAVRPRAAVMMETEIWPNLYRACRASGIPLLLANARLSPRSLQRYQRVRPLVRDTLLCLSGLAAQTSDDAERFMALGMPEARIRILGNTKWDAALATARGQARQGVAVHLERNRPIWVAASTHPGEEPIVLDAHARLLTSRPNALLIVAPRHPERFGPLHRRCLERGFRTSRRSSGAPADDDQIWIADSMGELYHWYSQADLAFIGGSLAASGGQNPLEAAAAGIPILHGPQVFNFSSIYQRLATSGGLTGVANSDELADGLHRLFGDPAACRQAGKGLQDMLQTASGAADATAEWLLTMLASGDGDNQLALSDRGWPAAR